MPASSSLTKGYLIAIIGTAIWSTTAIFIRYLNVHFGLPPMVLAFWRDLFSFLALAALTKIYRPNHLLAGLGQLRFLLLYGIILTIFNATWTVSVFYNGAAVSTVLAYSSGAFTAILGWRLFRERLDLYKILAVILSLAGCIFVSGAYRVESWRLNFTGVTTGLVSGLMMAMYSLMGRWAAIRNVKPLTSLTFSFGIASGFLFFLNFVLSPLEGISGDFLSLGSSIGGWTVLVLLAVGPTIGGYGLYTTSLAYLPASVANLIATLEPALTAILAYFFLSETLSLIQLFGSALILSGVIFLRWSEGRPISIASQKFKTEKSRI